MTAEPQPACPDLGRPRPGEQRWCPECGARIPGGHYGVFARRRGPHRRSWKVASFCVLCDVYWVVRVSCRAGRPSPLPSAATPDSSPRPARGAPLGAHDLYLSPVRRASGPERRMARRAVFGRRPVPVDTG